MASILASCNIMYNYFPKWSYSVTHNQEYMLYHKPTFFHSVKPLHRAWPGNDFMWLQVYKFPDSKVHGVSETSEWILSPTPDDAEKISKFMPTQPWQFRNIRPIHVFVLPGFITRIFQIHKLFKFINFCRFFKFINFCRYFPMIEFCRHLIIFQKFRIRWKPKMISKLIKVRSM